jgi:hypothetical protein
MDKNKKEQAEKLQMKLDKLLQTREKKQQAFVFMSSEKWSTHYN